jgi:hypothetical protein
MEGLAIDSLTVPYYTKLICLSAVYCKQGIAPKKEEHLNNISILYIYLKNIGIKIMYS